jgi:peptidoglycan/LPS O-acetylase OafA/YrhL
MPPQTAASSIKYRPDIDGLRAVAVLLVLANHLDTKATGGYIGVDVFFVISGYLISATILTEMGDGRFSIAGFYERRVRRIFPAMLAMMAIVSALTCLYLVPSEMMSYARSLEAALVSGSNFWFWHDGGYFDLPSNLKPLLHTWSLGVEEQFYVLFPLFLVLIRRWFPRRLKLAILAVTLLSFAAACWVVQRDAVAAFFFAPLRAWELLIGTIVSQRYLPALRGTVARNAAAAVGLALILWPAWVYGEYTRFPGPAALPPCLGAALIIAAGETGPSAVGRLLAWRPVAFIGLISYSLYLWHWPLIVFQEAGRMVVPGPAPSKLVKAALVLASVAVATLSWKFVEQPFRKGRWRPAPRRMFALAGSATLVLAAAGAAMLAAHGLPGRFPPLARQAASYVDYGLRHSTSRGCFLGPQDTFADFQVSQCLAHAPGEPTILVAGDSHASHLWAGVQSVYPDRREMEAAASNCPPLTVDVPRSTANCRALFDFLYDVYLPQHKVDVLLLSARWRVTDLPELGRTLDFLRQRGVPVVLFGPGIEYDAPEPRLIAFALRDGHPERIPAHLAESYRALDTQMKELARTRWHVPYVSVFDELCRPGCPVFAAPGVPFLHDPSHMTQEGATLLMKQVRADGLLP